MNAQSIVIKILIIILYVVLPLKVFSQVDTMCAKTSLRISITLQNQDKYREALDPATNAISCWRTNPLFWVNRASIKNDLQDYTGAKKDIDTAFLYGAKSSDFYRVKGENEYKTGNIAEAAKSFVQAINIDSRDDYSYYHLIGCYTYLGKYREALRYIDLSYKNFEPVRELLIRKAYCSFMIKDYQATVESCTSYLLKPGNEKDEAYTYKGMAYVKMQKYDLAIADLLIVDQNIESPFPLLYLGIAYREKEEFIKARTYFDKAILKDSTDAEVYWEYAVMEQAFVDRPEFTLSLLEKYEKNIGNGVPKPKIYLYKAACYNLLGDTTLTLGNLNKALKMDTSETFLVHFVRLGLFFGNVTYTDIQLDDLNYLINNNVHIPNEVPYFYCLKAYVNLASDNREGVYSSLEQCLSLIPDSNKSEILYNLAMYDLFYGAENGKARRVNKYLDEANVSEPMLDTYKAKAFIAVVYEKNGSTDALKILNEAEKMFKDDENKLVDIKDMEKSIEALNQISPLLRGKGIENSFNFFLFPPSKFTIMILNETNVSKVEIPPAVERYFQKIGIR